jgi:hypothetical protein
MRIRAQESKTDGDARLELREKRRGESGEMDEHTNLQNLQPSLPRKKKVEVGWASWTRVGGLGKVEDGWHWRRVVGSEPLEKRVEKQWGEGAGRKNEGAVVAGRSDQAGCGCSATAEPPWTPFASVLFLFFALNGTVGDPGERGWGAIKGEMVAEDVQKQQRRGKTGEHPREEETGTGKTEERRNVRVVSVFW